MKCEHCKAQTKGCGGVCRTCKSMIHHAYKRVKKEGLLVDTAGGSWWVWDKAGKVLVIGRDSKHKAVMALGTDADASLIEQN